MTATAVRKPLMPKATAVWLVENTSLSFDQIAAFCDLHPLEVRGIADGDVAAGIKGADPISNGQLTRDEIAKAEKNEGYRLKIAATKYDVPPVKTKKGPRYTPVSRRHDRPNAVVWLLRNHPELKDAQLMRLVGTTKPTIAAIRDKSHWNAQNLIPQDPVTMGLCTQIDLDAEVAKAAQRVARERKELGLPAETPASTLLPIDKTIDIPGMGPQPDFGAASFAPRSQADQDAADKVAQAAEEARILAQLQQMGGDKPKDDEDDGAE